MFVGYRGCPAVTPAREGSVSNDATAAMGPYSARCVRGEFGSSSGLQPSRCYGRRSALFSMARVTGARKIAPAVEVYK